MGVVDSIKDFYFRLEEKYYKFVDWLDTKHFPYYKFVDFVESRGIPSFPLSIAGIAVIALLLFFFAVPLLGIEFPIARVPLSVEVMDGKGNGIYNALVEIKGADFSEQGRTDGAGIAEFNVPMETQLTVSVEKSGFEKYADSFSVSREETKTIELSAEEISREILFKKKGTEELVEETINVSFECSNIEADFEEQRTVQNGRVELDGIPANCGLLEVKVEGFAVDKDIDLDETLPEVFLAGEEAGKGRVYVLVKEEETKKPLEGMRVVLVGAVERSDLSDESGSVVFEGVPAGDYYVKVMDALEYEDHVSDTKTLQEEDSVTFSIELGKAARAQINLKVVDATGEPVEKAALKLYRQGGTSVEYSGETDPIGQYTFNVPTETKYTLVVDKAGYFKAQLSVEAQEEFFEVTLKEQTSENGGSIAVSAKDQKGNAVENVKVELKLADGEFTGYSAFTGADGRAEFTAIEPGNYYVYGSKQGFEGYASNEFQVREREITSVQLVFVIGEGEFLVKVLDDAGNALAGASVEAIDVFTDRMMSQKTTDLEGIAHFRERVDRKVFFVTEADGFLPFVSLPFVPVQDSQREVEIRMIKGTGKIKTSMTLLLNDMEVREFVSAGESYKALVQLVLPSEYNKAGIHLRAGEDTEGKVNSAEEDIIFIREIEAANANIRTGSTYTPPFGSGQDYASNGSTKWANIEFEPGKKGLPSRGVFNAIAEVQVRDEAAMGEDTKISYRGYGVSATYSRDPIDAALGSAESSARKHGLYAQAYDRHFSVGQSNVCSGGYCRIIFIEDVESGMKSAVIDSFPANISSMYELNVKLNKAGAGSVRNAFLEVRNPEQGLEFGEYSISDAAGRKFEGNANGSELSKAVGDLAQDLSVSASIEFQTLKEGTNQIEISLASESGKVFGQTIKVNVRAGEELQLEIVPKDIVPFIDNQLLFRVSTLEDAPVPNAFIELSLDGYDLASGETDSAGIFAFELEAPSAGSELLARVKKNGYASLEKTMKIDESIIEIRPGEVRFDLEPKLKEFENIDLELINSTAVELEVAGVTVSDSLSGLVSVKGAEKLVGLELPLDGTVPVALTAVLTEQGKRAKETQVLEGSIGLLLKSGEFPSTWFSKVPVRARILLGGELDSSDCLVIEPNGWEIVSGGEQEKLSARVRNACTVDGKKVSLEEFSARVNWGSDGAIGTFYVSSGDLGDTEIALNPEFTLFAPELEKNFDGTLLVSFSPNAGVKSADAMPAIVFRGRHTSFNGEESVEERISVDISLSNLSKCVVVEADEPLKIKTAPSNLGWGLGQSYFYSSQSYQPYGFYPTGTGDYSMYGSAPQNFYGSYGWSSEESGAESSWGSEYATFRIKNECKDSVEVNMEASEGISLDKENIELAPRKSSSVKVESGAKSGTYSVDVEARLISSDDDYELAEVIDVEVLNMDELMQQCMPSIEPSVFKPNWFGIFRTRGRIYNRCYDYGFRLEMLMPQHFMCYTPKSSGEQLSAESCPLMSNFYSMPPRTIDAGENQTIEVVEFSFNLNESVKEEFDDFDSIESIGRLGNIVINNFSVTSPGIAAIPFRLPDSSVQQFSQRQVFFQVPYDLSAWLGWLSGRRPEDNVPPSAPDITITPKKPLTEDDILCTVQSSDADGDEIDYNINWLQGDRVLAHQKGSSNSLTLRSDLTRTGQEYTCEATACDKWACSEKNYSSVKVLRAEGPGTFAGFSACSSEETGEDAYRDYGFNRLAFSWKESDFGESSCSGSSGYFCDAVQFMLSLREKFRKVERTAEKLGNSPYNENALNLAAQSGADSFVPEAGNLYRFSKMQTVIPEKTGNREILFFLENSRTFLSPEKKDCAPDIVSTVRNNLSEIIAGSGGSNLDTLLSNMESEVTDCYGLDFRGENIVGVVNDRTISSDTIWKDLKEKGIVNATVNARYAIAFNDFKKLHSVLLENAGRDPEYEFSISFGGTETDDHNVQDWTTFIQKFYEALDSREPFKLGVVNRNGLSEETREYVRGNAAEISGLEGGNYVDGKTTAVNEAFLIGDNYSREFLGDFFEHGGYTFSGIDQGKVSFMEYSSLADSRFEGEESMPIESGKYYYKLTPTVDIAGGGVEVVDYEVSLALKKSLLELDQDSGKNYAMNPFLRLPFDAGGEILENASLEGGYGVAFTEKPEVDVYYFFDSAEETGHKALAGNSAGVRTLEIDFSNKFGELQGSEEVPGKIMELDLSQGMLEYAPSWPVALELEWGEGMQNTVFYRFEREYDEYYGNARRLFTWWIGEDRKAGDSLQNYDGGDYDFCTEWAGTRKLARVEMEEPGTWTAFAFVPAEQGAEEMSLELLCAEEITQISARTYDMRVGSTDSVKGISGGAVHINVERSEKPPSFKRYIEAIERGEVCVRNAGEEKMVLSWNPQILEDLRP